MKPLGIKNYGSIAHIPSSRMGPGDHSCPAGQAAIATIKTRDKHDFVVCLEKLDGSNVGVAKADGAILPLTRSGYLANTSPYEQHHRFSEWVYAHQAQFSELLQEGERVVGEWLLQAHGTRYNLPHEPFVAFDFLQGGDRKLYGELIDRAADAGIETARVLSFGYHAFSLESALKAIQVSGHGAIDAVEGVVWRVERKNKVEFLCKYVRPEKVDGCYLSEISGQPVVWNRFKGDAASIFSWLYPQTMEVA